MKNQLKPKLFMESKDKSCKEKLKSDHLEFFIATLKNSELVRGSDTVRARTDR